MTSIGTAAGAVDELPVGTMIAEGDMAIAMRGTVLTSRKTSPYGSFASRLITACRISIGTPSIE